MTRTAYRLLLLTLLPSGALAQDNAESSAPPVPLPPLQAPPSAGSSPAGEDSKVLATPRSSILGEEHALAAVEFQGLRHLTEPQVRELAHVPLQGSLSSVQAGALVRRLARTGLFSKVDSTVRLAQGSAPVLVVSLEEQPFITSVVIEGVNEGELEDLEDELFQQPRQGSDDEDDEDEDEDKDEDEDDPVDVRIGFGPDRPWASSSEGQFHPGFAWRGLSAGLKRVVKRLRDRGDVLASLDATLSPDGQLVLRVDTGFVDAVEVEGVDEDVAARVREALGIQPGDPLLRSDLKRAEVRLEERLPFLSLEEVKAFPRTSVRFVEERQADGTRHYRPGEGSRPSRMKTSGARSRRRRDEAPNFARRSNRVLVRMHPRGQELSLRPALLHTPVTGLAPALWGSLKLWDARDRVHPTLEAALALPLRLGNQRVPGDPEQTARQREMSWLVGAKLEVPALGLAEIGLQVHDFTDSADRWRIGLIDSSLYSALLNRPDAEYFRRRGYTGLATWRLGRRWLFGAEYRRDTYSSQQSLSPPLRLLWPHGVTPFVNSAVDEGQMASVVGRVEYASDADRVRDVGSLFRAPELSLLGHAGGWAERSASRHVLTVEVGKPELGGDARFDFWRVVSDNVLYVMTGHHEGLRLRLRGAGGENLPRQKEEGLGGWSALRGYDFKEFRGDVSLLASGEYRFGFVGAFADVGSVYRKQEGWMKARLGVGAQVYFGDWVHLAAAWRTDARATAIPDVRLLFSRPF
ncbi:hypothetical protein CYFUS_004928 [Cystobacter fuscus]|uniref:POTRA domain-containing protein n=1 Tax=Cystobacter fuscus TaxID=43 RepID=A0A250J6E2_9BACT|nr:hypothetical protein CYFUS_004928 [Cystobacter fuscus]